MPENTAFAATLLERSAGAYAGYAASVLLEGQPDLVARLGGDARELLAAQLADRLLELSAALLVGRPELFQSRVVWSRQLARAREASDDALRDGLSALRDVLREKLPVPTWSEVEPYLEPALASFSEPVAESDSILDPEHPGHRLALEYLLAILEGDGRRAIELIARAVADGLTPQRAYLDVLLPAQEEVGRMWHTGEVNVAEEHFVTSTTQKVMSLLSAGTGPPPSNGRTVLVAGVAANAHDMGLRALADFFELDGWRVIRLGANTPSADLVRATHFFRADLVALSASLTTQLKALERAVTALRESSRPVKILVGGLAFADAPDLWRELGADGYAPTIDRAVRLGTELVDGG